MFLGYGWCWPSHHSIFELVGRQVCVTKVIFLCTDAELAKMTFVICVTQIRHTLLARFKNCEAGQHCFRASPTWLGCGWSSPGINENLPIALFVFLFKSCICQNGLNKIYGLLKHFLTSISMLMYLSLCVYFQGSSFVLFLSCVLECSCIFNVIFFKFVCFLGCLAPVACV